LRWAPAGTEQTSDAWTVQPIGNTRPATLINGLIPGTSALTKNDRLELV